MTYQEVFGGTTIYPSDVSLLRLVLNGDVQLEWPLEASGEDTPVARIIEASPTVSGHRIIMPDAVAAAPGQTILFDNRSVTASFNVVDFFGGVIMTVGAGKTWQCYLADNPTPAGIWFSFQFGASTATVQPSALAGYGLTVTDTTLSVAVPVLIFSITGLTVATSNRATAFVWEGLGSGVLNLLSAPSAGNNFIFHVRNNGGGDLTLDPAGGETINNGATLVLHPGDSASVFTDGLEWYTVGLGQKAVFAFDYTAINVSVSHPPDPAGTYTLRDSELNRISYMFTGALTTHTTVVVPAGVQQYWIHNATTGPYTFSVKTSAVGSVPVAIAPNAKGIYYSNGTNLIIATDSVEVALPVSVGNGGTGATAPDDALLNLGVTAAVLPFLQQLTVDEARAVIVGAKSGANSDITSMTALTGITAATLTVTGAFSATGNIGSAQNIGAALDLTAGQDVRATRDGVIGRNLSVAAAFTAGSVTTSGGGDVAIGNGGDLVINAATQPNPFSSIFNDVGDLRFGTDGLVRLVLDKNGLFNVGAVAGSNIALNVESGALFKQTAAPSTGAVIIRGAAGNGAGYLQFINDNVSPGEFGSIAGHPTGFNINASIPGGNINLLTQGTPRLFINSAGNIGVNKTNQAYTFDINGTLASSGGYYGNWVAGNITGNLGWLNNSAITVVGNSAIIAQGTFRISDPARGGGNYFMECTTGADLWFCYGGGSGNPSANFHGNMQVNGNINANGNITAFSDRKLKENLAPITKALAKVLSLTGCTFDRVDAPELGRQTGLIAQDVQAVLPEAVGTAKDGTLTLAYGNLAGLFVEAFKDMQGELDALRAEVAKLTGLAR